MKPTYLFVCASLLVSIASSAFALDMTCGGKVTQAAITAQNPLVPDSKSKDKDLVKYLQVAAHICTKAGYNADVSNNYWALAVNGCQQGMSPGGNYQTSGCYKPAVTLHNLKP